jgi:phage terminase large subunit
MMRIEAVRRIMPVCWFNAATTEAGRDALGFYHERRDEQRSLGLGLEHDWSSHAADAFGLMAISYDDPGIPKQRRAYKPPRRHGESWMSA